MYFIGIVIVPVLLLNVLIVTMCKRKDFERYIFVNGNSYNFFFSLSRCWHQQQYYLETGTNSSIVSSAVVKVLLWKA